MEEIMKIQFINILGILNRKSNILSEIRLSRLFSTNPKAKYGLRTEEILTNNKRGQW